MKVQHLLSEDDIRRVNEAIGKAESGTSGEIVPVIVAQSSDYREITLLGGIFGALVVYVATAWVRHIDRPSQVLLTLAAGYIFGSLLSLLSGVRRHLIGDGFAENETWRRAALEFQLNQVGRTAARTGILILVSLLERRVVVYGDQPIAQKMKPGAWSDVRDLIIRGLASGRAADGLVAGILRCGEHLTEHFPRQEDDKDEIPNRVILKTH